MFKRPALWLAATIIGLGIIFLLLDVLDIAEGYRLHLSMAILNTIFIGAVATFITCLTAREYLSNGSPEILGLGGAAISFGSGILFYSWLNADLNTRVAAYDSGFLLASLIVFTSVALSLAGQGGAKAGPAKKLIALCICLPLIIAIIGTVTWLASRDWVNFLNTVGNIGTRDIMHGTGAVFLVASAAIYVRNYLKSHRDFFFWYFLGLILLAGGVIFVGQGPLESRIAWLGRLSQYTGCIYLLISAFEARKLRKAGLRDSGR